MSVRNAQEKPASKTLGGVLNGLQILPVLYKLVDMRSSLSLSLLNKRFGLTLPTSDLATCSSALEEVVS